MIHPPIHSWCLFTIFRACSRSEDHKTTA
jgi:hypothetical protein